MLGDYKNPGHMHKAAMSEAPTQGEADDGAPAGDAAAGEAVSGFEEGPPRSAANPGDTLIVDLDGFEGRSTSC